MGRHQPIRQFTGDPDITAVKLAGAWYAVQAGTFHSCETCFGGQPGYRLTLAYTGGRLAGPWSAINAIHYGHVPHPGRDGEIVTQHAAAQTGVPFLDLDGDDAQ